MDQLFPERVHINVYARIFGKIHHLLPSKTLPGGNLPAAFYLTYEHILLINPHIYFM